jgi:hypothetical protein
VWRYLAGAVAALLMAGAGMILFQSGATPPPMLPAPPADKEENSRALSRATPLIDEIPRASDRTREEKRFDRYDKDRDDAITPDEYLSNRRKAYAKLDRNGDGKLSFEEWAVRTTGKFASADKDRSNTLTRSEFATTAPKRTAKPACKCETTGSDKNGED